MPSDPQNRTWTRVELDTRIHRPVIDVTACCGPDGTHVWMNCYEAHGAFLTVDEAIQLAQALEREALNTAAKAKQVAPNCA